MHGHGHGPRAGPAVVVVAVAVVLVVALVELLLSPPIAAWAGTASSGLPTASISTFDCDRLEVKVTLDNTRSTAPLTYGYGASFRRPSRAPYSGVDATARILVAAGDTATIVLPVRDDARTVVTAFLPDGGHVLSAGTCGEAPGATFALADCDTLRLGLALDNTRSTGATRYRWTLIDPAGPARSATVDVEPGRAAAVDVPLVQGSRTRVDVAVDGKGLVATSDWVRCGSFFDDPRASFGEIDCGTVSAPLLLDNSRTTSRTRFRLPGHVDVVLGPGQTRTFRLHLPLRAPPGVTVSAVVQEAPPVTLAQASTTWCEDTSPAQRAATPPAAPSGHR